MQVLPVRIVTFVGTLGSHLNATLALYYVLPHRKFPEAFGTQVFKHRHQEFIRKADETVTLKFINGQAVVL